MNIIGYEAVCQSCGESFNPCDEEDLEHLWRFEGDVECGGTGVLVGAWGT